MATPPLTAVRRAIWEVIDGWSSFQGYWKQKIKYEDPLGKGIKAQRVSDLGMVDVAVQDLPCLEIGYQSSPMGFAATGRFEIQPVVEFSWVTPHWDLRRSEWIWYELVKVAFSSSVRAAAGPPSVGNLVIQPSRLANDNNSPNGTFGSFTVQFRTCVANPITEGPTPWE